MAIGKSTCGTLTRTPVCTEDVHVRCDTLPYTASHRIVRWGACYAPPFTYYWEMTKLDRLVKIGSVEEVI